MREHLRRLFRGSPSRCTGKRWNDMESTSDPCNCKCTRPDERQAIDKPVTTADVRRFFPPLRRRPHPAVVVVRWWYELAIVALLGAASWSAVGLLGGPGAVALGIVLGVTAAAVAALVEPVRDALFGVLQRAIVPHRLRLGFVRGGVITRDGRLPAIVRSRCRVDQARCWVRLPSGLLVEDLAAAGPVLAGSCGATGVIVSPDGPRQDRAIVVVARPRWGWPGH
ncbi:hypothetical protein [Pseudonocardia cypriaca]|uniref:hypothetical protein n=1 Tax=Pseudonocardia cypriaca TaxID=882449 RepID=UPI00114FC7A4|nr:hypothetical protein [Pseudonocardia cypriaca]